MLFVAGDGDGVQVSDRLAAVNERIAGDVGDVLVSQGVHRFLPSPGCRHQTGRTQHPKVLGGE
jgi:hypothetical protein